MRELPFKVGDEIKNYKEMCKLLDEKERAGNSKKSQMQRWEKLFNWTKKGHGFKITEIHETTYLHHDDNRIGQGTKSYNEYIQHLILDALHFYQEENSYKVSLEIAHKGLIGVTNLFNRVFYNLSFDKKYREKISKEIGVKESLLKEFFNKLNSTAHSDIETALRQLQRKGLIFVNKILLVKPSEVYEKGIPISQVALMEEFFTEHDHPELTDQFTLNYGVVSESTYTASSKNTSRSYFFKQRVATDFEQSGILLCRHVALKNLNMNNTGQVHAQDKLHEFQIEMSRLTKKYLGINYSFAGFQIVFSKPVLKKKSLLNSFNLPTEKIRELQISTQDGFKKSVYSNYQKRYSLSRKAIKKAHVKNVYINYDAISENKEFVGQLCSLKDLPRSYRILQSIENENELDKKLHQLFSLVLKEL